MKDGIIRLLWRYIKGRWFQITAFLIFFCIFLTVFYLYQIAVEPVLYATYLCLVFACMLLIISFLRFLRNQHTLSCMIKNVSLLDGTLPAAHGLLDEEYQTLVVALWDLNRALQTNVQIQRKDSIDYYTTWVHQIKTPIAAMRLILQGEDTTLHQELQAELFRIEQYVDMVLCYFRLDSSSNDFVFQEYVIDDIIKATLRKYAGQFVRKRIALHYEAHNSPILTDEKWFGFVLEQLLSNAIKYTDQGSVSIQVDEQQQVLTIQDTGMGIAPEDLPRIFEKGFTGYNGRSNKKSTGLGLYLCAQAIRKLSHQIHVTSTIGCGTTVTIQYAMKQITIE